MHTLPSRTRTRARIEGEDMTAEGEKVSARGVMSGTHQAEFQGIASTDRKAGAEARAIDILCIANGKRSWSTGGARRQPR